MGKVRNGKKEGKVDETRQVTKVMASSVVSKGPPLRSMHGVHGHDMRM
jgi:hypothetical protein